MRILKIIMFLAALVAIWVLSRVVAAGTSEGEPSKMVLFITSAIVLVPSIWLGRRLFRREPSHRIFDASDDVDVDAD